MPYLIDAAGIESLRHIREKLSSNNLISAREASALGDMIFATMARLEEVLDDEVKPNNEPEPAEIEPTGVPADIVFGQCLDDATNLLKGRNSTDRADIVTVACAMMAYEGHRMIARALESDSIMGDVTLDDLIAAAAQEDEDQEEAS